MRQNVQVFKYINSRRQRRRRRGKELGFFVNGLSRELEMPSFMRKMHIFLGFAGVEKGNVGASLLI